MFEGEPLNMTNYSKKLVQGTTIIMLFMAFSSILGYALKFIFARHLDVEEIGLFYSVLGFVSFFIFFRDIGLSESLIYFIPRFIVEKAKSKIKSSILFTISVQLLNGVLFFILVFILSSFLTENYFKDPRAQIILISLSVYFIFNGFNEVLSRTFHAYQNIFLNQGIEFMFQLFSFVFFVFIIFSDMSVKMFGFAYLLSAILTFSLFLYIFLKKIFPDFFKTKANISKKHRKKMLNYSIPAMTGSLAAQIFSQQSIFFLTFFVGLEAVGYYVMARALAKVSTYFFKAMTLVFFPIMSELWKKQDIKKLNFYFKEVLTFSFIVGFPLSLTLIFFSEEILRILYGELFIGATIILKLSSIYFLFYSFNGILKRVFLSIGQPKISRNITYVTMISSLILNLILVQIYGLIGVVIADLLSVVITSIYAIYIKNRNLRLHLPWSKLVKISAASFFFVVIIITLKRAIDFSIFIELPTILFFSGLIYVGMIFYLKLISIQKINTVLKALTNNKIRLPFSKVKEETEY